MLSRNGHDSENMIELKCRRKFNVRLTYEVSQTQGLKLITLKDLSL